jgi:predicted  nucleic acid-binding Zn-ribbon protein
MSDQIKVIQKLQEKIQNNKTEIVRFEENLKRLKEDKNKILEELKTLNIDEKDLEKKIIVMEEELRIEIEKIEQDLK